MRGATEGLPHVYGPPELECRINSQVEGNLGILQCDMVPKAGGEASMAASPLCAPVFRGTQESVGGILTPGVAGVQAVQGWPNTGSLGIF